MLDIQKWFKDVHNLEVTHYQLMTKMGFRFGKMRKLCLRRESASITNKRRIYLKRRLECNKRIECRISERQMWENNGQVGPCPS